MNQIKETLHLCDKTNHVFTKVKKPQNGYQIYFHLEVDCNCKRGGQCNEIHKSFWPALNSNGFTPYWTTWESSDCAGGATGWAGNPEFEFILILEEPEGEEVSIEKFCKINGLSYQEIEFEE